jgi:hypothetical protein
MNILIGQEGTARRGIQIVMPKVSP